MIGPLFTVFDKVAEPSRSCLQALADIILAEHEAIANVMKYNCSCFTYQGKWFCYLNYDRKRKVPYIGFTKGYLMQPNAALLSEGRTQIKIYLIDPEADMDIDTIRRFLHEAMALAK
jgi:hypothetical protein